MVKKTEYRVFFDFDNTIATCDVFDSLLPRFSKNDLWIKLEEEWNAGRIGSRECLAGQLRGLDLKKSDLEKHLTSIKIDPYFKKIVKLLDKRGVKAFILSDNFDYILKQVLIRNSINNLKVYSNRIRFSRGKLIPHFPFKGDKCSRCAHCKTKNLLANTTSGSEIIYVGDGRSDMCPAQHADMVFAKDALLEHCRDKKIRYRPYKGLKEVYEYLKRRG